jgi:hypothetical protein
LPDKVTEFREYAPSRENTPFKDGEYHGVGADAERQHDHNDRGQGEALAQHAPAVR